MLPGLSRACVCSSLFASWFILCRSLNPLNLFFIWTLLIGLTLCWKSDCLAKPPSWSLSLRWDCICLLGNPRLSSIVCWLDWCCLTGKTTSLLLFSTKLKGRWSLWASSRGRISCWSSNLGLPLAPEWAWTALNKSQIFSVASFAAAWQDNFHQHSQLLRSKKVILISTRPI